MCTSQMIVCSPINNSKEKGKKTEEQIASTFRRDSKQDTIQRYHLAGITFVAVQKYQVETHHKAYPFFLLLLDL